MNRPSALRWLCIALFTGVVLFTLRPLAWFIPNTLLVNRTGFSQAVYDDKGGLLQLSLSSDDKYRLWVPLKDISPSMIQATLAQEDAWFYWHPGINPISFIRAATTTLTSGKNIGGSTITMQLARIRYGLYTRSILGKLNQILHALLLENSFTKNEILEAYLNLAPYGLNIEGVGAAARIYFDKKSSDLSLAESITLSVIPQHPSKRAPLATQDLSSLREAEARLIERFSPALGVSPVTAIKSRRDLPKIAPHFCNRVLDENPYSSEVYTSLKRDIQTLIERQVEKFTERNQRLNIKNASVLIVDTQSAGIVGYLGSASYMNPDIQGFVDGIQGRRSPGSALKPFIYALAIDNSFIHPGTVLKDTSFIRAQYNPENFEKDFVGPLSATEALIRSRNIPAVMLLNQLTPGVFLNFLRAAGLKNLREESYYGLSMALGGAETRLDELVGLYVGLANGGRFGPLHSQRVDRAPTPLQQLISPEASRLVLEMLSENPRPHASIGAQILPYQIQIPWKTGTSYSFRDAWAIGIVGRYAIGVWVGNFDGKPNSAFIGREAAGPLFFAIADGLIASEHLYETWRSGKLNIKRVQVCALSGQLPHQDCPHRKLSWYIPGKSPITTCSIHRKISVNKTRTFRTCPESLESGESVVYEFWPSDLASLYESAGLPRRSPPPYAPECSGTRVVGTPPLISSPTAFTDYILHEDNRTIPLSAVSDADTKRLFWFFDDTLIGDVEAGKTLHWTPMSGSYTVRVVDEQGRANQVSINVREP